jgi:selenocysteine-specific elongation factor
VFTLNGTGLVVTGTAFSGCIAVGDVITLTPPGLAARVRGLHVQDRPAPVGRAGQRIAINLAGDIEKADVARGMWVVAPRLHLPVQRFHAEVRVLDAIPQRLPVHVHLGAARVPGRLALLSGGELAPGEDALAEIVLDRRIGALAHDRFVLRDPAANRTLGGGRVLDVFPPARHKRSPERLALLRQLGEADHVKALRATLAGHAAGVDLRRFALGRNLDDPDAVWRVLGLTVVREDRECLGFTPEAWRSLGERLLAALAAEHERAADMVGIERERLRRLTLPALPRAAFDRLVAELQDADRLSQTGGWLHLPGHRASLAAADADLWGRLRAYLDAAPLQPPRVRDIARGSGVAEDKVRGLLKRVARIGLAYPVAHDHYFTAEAVARLAAQVDALCMKDGAARAAALRDAIGGGRKVAIQILEFFDRVGYTRRVRDVHVRREPGTTRQWIVQ